VSKFFQTLIILLYIYLSLNIEFGIVGLFGKSYSIQDELFLGCVWTLFCFLSHLFIADYNLFMHLPVRKPVLIEEKRLDSLLQSIVEKSTFRKKIRIRITEEKNLNAFAIGRRTISVSKGLLEAFSNQQLQGVLAHELGHLQNRDYIRLAAYVMARNLPFPFYFRMKSGIHWIRKNCPILHPLFNLFGVIVYILPAIVAVSVYKHHQLLLFTIVVLCFAFYRTMLNLFDFFWRATVRVIEYKQDAFAHQLGFGNELREALERLIGDEARSVNLYENMMKFDHPVIYNRIRRLEKLGGLRQ